MTVSNQVQHFKSLGFSGKDVRHIGVTVYPALVLENGQPVKRHKVYIGEEDGNYRVDFPTDFVFAIISSGWVFESFELGGKTWPGLAIYPDDADFAVKFGDDSHTSVVMTDHCGRFCVHRYQIVLRNTSTGEIAVSDPSTSNGDRPDAP